LPKQECNAGHSTDGGSWPAKDAKGRERESGIASSVLRGWRGTTEYTEDTEDGAPGKKIVGQRDSAMFLPRNLFALPVVADEQGPACAKWRTDMFNR
jgi:hypothetical protein